MIKEEIYNFKNDIQEGLKNCKKGSKEYTKTCNIVFSYFFLSIKYDISKPSSNSCMYLPSIQ